LADLRQELSEAQATPGRAQAPVPVADSTAIAAAPAAEAGSATRAARTEPAFNGFVVGIGASAGGLDALERFFTALAPDTGAAFVIVQHLSPDHKSMMDNLLARHTAMPVRVAEHEMPLAANALFLIPPGKTMRVAGDRLLLAPKPEHGLSLPIDIFFHSQAEQCGERAIAVVLSGTGSDGSRGLAAVNASGGFVFVQDPSSAKFDGMPRSAIATGQVDVVAPAADLALRLMAHLRAPRGPGLVAAGRDGGAGLALPLDGILERLLASSGIDFREYKPTTVLRRIERRMQVLHAPSLADYLQRLNGSLDEQTLLRRELLIPVTRFFRDAEAFEQLAEAVLPQLLQPDAEGVTSSEPIRVWVACCATGEEAYSIAILFAEAFRRLGRSRPVKIFATDVEAQYLDHAAAGLYADTIAAEVSAQRLQQFFIERGGAYAVRPEIRQMVIFARHNLVADPPFTRMDLVSCRNALIYFQPVAQERALQRLQYALQPGGHLLLGPSESLGILQRDFAPLPGRHKVFRLLRRERLSVSLEPAGRHRPTASRRAFRASALAATGAPALVPVTDWVGIGQRALQQAYGPLSLLIGPGRELLHVYGDAAGLLQLSAGEATLDVLKLLPRELGWAATLLLQAVAAEGRAQNSAALRLPAPPVAPGLPEPAPRLVRLAARPLQAAPGEAASGLVLLSLEPLDATALGAAPASAGELAALDVAQQRRVETLERELELTHDSLQASIEALETANEELQATNEELMASNEELQSTNEELQSVNEELYTVNAEYQEKVDILNSVNADLESISKAAAIPTLFVDEHLLLTRFTPEAALLFKVRPGDRGRSIEDFAHTLDYPELFTDLRRTLAGGVALEREVKSRDGQWWLARLQPYARQISSHTPGAARAVLTFFNISSVKDSQRLQAVVDSLAEHVAVVDPLGNITLVNAAWRRFAGDNGDGALQFSGPGRNYLEVCARAALEDEDARRAYEGLAAVLGGAQSSFTLQYPCHTAEQRRWFLMHVAPVAHPGGGAVVSHIDVTPWVQAAQQDTTTIDSPTENQA
jgi:two-component system CheB/CheR fusion protein